MIIDVGRHDHLSSDAVNEMIRERYGKCEVTDACAVTIAAWYASPGSEGRAFAALATTGKVSLGALLDDIDGVRGTASRTMTGISVYADLDMLATWAIAHTRIGSDDHES